MPVHVWPLVVGGGGDFDYIMFDHKISIGVEDQLSFHEIGVLHTHQNAMEPSYIADINPPPAVTANNNTTVFYMRAAPFARFFHRHGAVTGAQSHHKVSDHQGVPSGCSSQIGISRAEITRGDCCVC